MNDLLDCLGITSPLFFSTDVLTSVVDNDQSMRNKVRMYVLLWTIIFAVLLKFSQWLNLKK